MSIEIPATMHKVVATLNVVEESPEIWAGCTPWLRDKILEKIEADPKLSQRKVAKLVGISPSRLGQILHDPETTSPYLPRICEIVGLPRYYGLPVSDLHRRVWAALDAVIGLGDDAAEEFTRFVDRAARSYRSDPE